MADEFKPGDRVEWNTPQGKTQGKVLEKLTSRTEVSGQSVAASDDAPATSWRAKRAASAPPTSPIP